MGSHNFLSFSITCPKFAPCEEQPHQLMLHICNFLRSLITCLLISHNLLSPCFPTHLQQSVTQEYRMHRKFYTPSCQGDTNSRLVHPLSVATLMAPPSISVSLLGFASQVILKQTAGLCRKLDW